MTNENILNLIQKVRMSIEREENAYLDIILEENADYADMINEIRPLAARGKKMRSLLMLAGYFAGGGKEKEKILRAACTMDFLQHAMLIFDDVMDCALTRHGHLTIDQKFKRWVKKKYSLGFFKAGHYGRSVAELAGLFALKCADDVLARSEFDPELKIKAIQIFNKTTKITIAGQNTDLKMSLMPLDGGLREKDIIKMMEDKTGIYTIGSPFEVGWILAGGNSELLKTIMPILLKLGIAFQIRDDIIGMFGDEAKTGKSAGSDIVEGKRTLLILKAWEKASWAQKWHIKRTLGDKKAKKESIDRIKDIVKETGSLEYCENLVKELSSRARDELKEIQIENGYKVFLEDLIKFLIEREY